MDTKSKNIKYRLGTKIVAVVILWLSGITFFASGMFFLLNTDVITTDSYEQTYRYKDEMNRLIHNTVELATKFKHGANKGLDPSRYKSIEMNLSNAVNFNYYMKDLKTEKISYKIPGDYQLETFKDDLGAIHINIDGGSLDVNRNDRRPFYVYPSNDVERMLTDSPQEIVVVMNDPLVPGDVFYEMYSEYTMIKAYMPYAIGGLIGSTILILASLGYLVLVSGRKEKGGEVILADIDRIYNDVQSLFLLIAASLSLIILIEIISNTGLTTEIYSPQILLVIFILALDVAIGMIYFFSMLRQFKKGVLLKNTLLFKVINSGINLVGMCFNDKIFKSWILGLMLAYGLINGVLFILAADQELLVYPLFIIPFNGLAVYMAFKRLKSLTMIMNGAKEISNGNLDYELDQSQLSIEFEAFGRDIQSIQGGLKNAVNEAIKGERMKTDLITNVSHDLKTPLTSIINYVDLLKQEELNSERADGYIEILEEKSYRLKQLIEDLIEASKASSGNISITKEEVDLHELIIQACGEYEEKIKESQLDFRINAPEEKVFVLADGKYMWRIIENIMSNALKYSMKGSRIYIDIEEKDGYGRLTMKNMSAYPLDIDASQLTERFIRADESRTTEGSGLGLSIAQSLTSIQDGRFHIEIDGDLFKVTVEMALTGMGIVPKK